MRLAVAAAAPTPPDLTAPPPRSQPQPGLRTVSSSSMQTKPRPTMPKHTHPFHCGVAHGRQEEAP